jgi:hypothetical protein
MNGPNSVMCIQNNSILTELNEKQIRHNSVMRCFSRSRRR